MLAQDKFTKNYQIYVSREGIFSTVHQVIFLRKEERTSVPIESQLICAVLLPTQTNTGD